MKKLNAMWHFAFKLHFIGNVLNLYEKHCYSRRKICTFHNNKNRMNEVFKKRKSLTAITIQIEKLKYPIPTIRNENNRKYPPIEISLHISTRITKSN